MEGPNLKGFTQHTPRHARLVVCVFSSSPTGMLGRAESKDDQPHNCPVCNMDIIGLVPMVLHVKTDYHSMMTCWVKGLPIMQCGVCEEALFYISDAHLVSEKHLLNMAAEAPNSYWRLNPCLGFGHPGDSEFVDEETATFFMEGECHEWYHSHLEMHSGHFASYRSRMRASGMPLPSEPCFNQGCPR